MFNLQGSELLIILLLALVVLGPEKLPEAMRKLGELYAQLKKMSSGFQQEFRAATDEPLREIRETANTLRDSVDFRKFSTGEREEKPKSGEMASAPPVVAPADPTAVPTTDVPFQEPDTAAAPADSAALAESADATAAPATNVPFQQRNTAAAPVRQATVDVAAEAPIDDAAPAPEPLVPDPAEPRPDEQIEGP